RAVGLGRASIGSSGGGATGFFELPRVPNTMMTAIATPSATSTADIGNLAFASEVPPGSTVVRLMRPSGSPPWHLGHLTYPGTTATPHVGQTALMPKQYSAPRRVAKFFAP